jgi:hypothetical protein
MKSIKKETCKNSKRNKAKKRTDSEVSFAFPCQIKTGKETRKAEKWQAQSKI